MFVRLNLFTCNLFQIPQVDHSDEGTDKLTNDSPAKKGVLLIYPHQAVVIHAMIVSGDPVILPEKVHVHSFNTVVVLRFSLLMI